LANKVLEELARLRADYGSGKLKNVHQIKTKRHDLARIKTVVRARQLTALEESPGGMEKK
jgi:ribosomal protein L29